MRQTAKHGTEFIWRTQPHLFHIWFNRIWGITRKCVKPSFFKTIWWI